MRLYLIQIRLFRSGKHFCAKPTGWGYRLYLRYKLLINQPIIPALAGNKPFKNETDARKIAKLASSKIAKGQMPPTLEVKEIKKLLNLK